LHALGADGPVKPAHARQRRWCGAARVCVLR
jgi:hypothetical protein